MTITPLWTTQAKDTCARGNTTTWNNIKEMVARTAQILDTLLIPAVWFVAILEVAVRRGFVRRRVQEHRTWMLQWMFAVVHRLESDAVCES
jgi:hypothetical protein